MVSAVEPKVAKLSDMDDIEVHLTTFECLMTVDSVNQPMWAVWLAPHLIGKAQLAHTTMRETKVMKLSYCAIISAKRPIDVFGRSKERESPVQSWWYDWRSFCISR